MKLTSFAILFIVIILPFLFITGHQLTIINEDTMLRAYYDSVIDNAVQDAAFVISQNAKNFSYGSKAIHRLLRSWRFKLFLTPFTIPSMSMKTLPL